MTDTRELVDELRLIGCHANGDARCTCGIGQDAADTITALSERCRAMEEALHALIRERTSMKRMHRAKVELLTKERDEARTALDSHARTALASGGRG